MDTTQPPLIAGQLTVMDYLHGKVADYTVSENVISSACFDRDVTPSTAAEDVEQRLRQLLYADLLKYIYLSPNLTKSYSQTNGVWSQKEGSTQLSEDTKKKILAEMRKIYGMYGEPEALPTPKASIRMNAHGMKMHRY